MDDDEDDDDGDYDFGSKKKKAKAAKPPKAPKELKIRIKRESAGKTKLISESGHFPMRQEVSESSDDDYAAKSHKKKVKKTGSARDTPESGYADAMGVWRRGAAKKVVTYDEAQADYGLESEDDEVYYPSGMVTPGEFAHRSELMLAAIDGEADEIDLVLSHSRDEDRLNDPKDIPQENLVSHTP